MHPPGEAEHAGLGAGNLSVPLGWLRGTSPPFPCMSLPFPMPVLTFSLVAVSAMCVCSVWQNRLSVLVLVATC